MGSSKPPVADGYDAIDLEADIAAFMAAVPGRKLLLATSEGRGFVAAVGETALTFRVNVDNVANKRYWASAFDNFSSALLQGLPRTVKASVTAEF